MSRAYVGPTRTCGDGQEDTGQLSAEQQVLRSIVSQRRSGRQLADILGDAAPQLLRRQSSPVSHTERSNGARSQEMHCDDQPPVDRFKQPTFVPYEPYRACVSRIASAHTCGALKNTSKHKQRRASTDAGISKPPLLNATGDARDEVLRLAADKERLREQLALSHQVCEELKRLMVATLGEDMEGRLTLMTEDKARMASMVRDYSSTVSEQLQDQEHLTIQCDVWRSKFMACSLMVDELAAWKGALSMRVNRFQQLAQCVLRQNSSAHAAVLQSLSTSDDILQLLDPAASAAAAAAPPAGLDLLQASQQLSERLQLLHRRLTAVNTRNNATGSGSSSSLPATADERCASERRVGDRQFSAVKSEAEHELQQLMCSEVRGGGGVVARDACRDRGMLDRFHPRAKLEHLTIGCCQHCSGDVHVV